MQSRKGVAGSRMIKLLLDGNALPIVEAMTLLAVWSQAALVLVFMAGGARTRQTQEGMAQIFACELTARIGWDVLGRVTLHALESGMFAFEHVPRFRVIEFSWRRVPTGDRKIFTIVLGMAGNTLFLRL